MLNLNDHAHHARSCVRYPRTHSVLVQFPSFATDRLFALLRSWKRILLELGRSTRASLPVGGWKRGGLSFSRWISRTMNMKVIRYFFFSYRHRIFVETRTSQWLPLTAVCSRRRPRKLVLGCESVLISLVFGLTAVIHVGRCCAYS
jgi:hypothetical protein